VFQLVQVVRGLNIPRQTLFHHVHVFVLELIEWLPVDTCPELVEMLFPLATSDVMKSIGRFVETWVIHECSAKISGVPAEFQGSEILVR
jgi:hypothetical protein